MVQTLLNVCDNKRVRIKFTVYHSYCTVLGATLLRIVYSSIIGLLIALHFQQIKELSLTGMCIKCTKIALSKIYTPFSKPEQKSHVSFFNRYNFVGYCRCHRCIYFTLSIS